VPSLSYRNVLSFGSIELAEISPVRISFFLLTRRGFSISCIGTHDALDVYR